MSAEEIEGLPAVRLRAGDLEAAFVPGAGMVGASLRHRGEELLGQRDGLAGYVARGKTMGIPLLHPWANRLGGDEYLVAGARVSLRGEGGGLRREEHGLPIHGLLAGSPDWRVVDAGPEHVAARLDFGARADRLARFPFPHTVAVLARLEPGGLRIDTTVEATGEVPVPVAFGWHPYLQLPGAPREAWVLELPARRHLLTDDRGIPTGATERAPARGGPLGEETYDDGYDELARPELALSGGGRRVAVRLLEGYGVTQVFAPPGSSLVALEPMTAPVDALRSGRGLRLVAPGGAFTASFALDVAPA